MAEGGDVTGRRSYTDTDDLADNQCFLCCKKHLKSKATKYCITCEEQYCSDCVGLHDLIPTLAGHSIVEKYLFDRKHFSERKIPPPIPTVRCVNHPSRLIDMYCKTHATVGCVTCIGEKHK